VLWVVFFLTMAVASLVLAIRSNVHQSSSIAAAAEAEGLADAGLHLALMDLVNGQFDPAWRRRFQTDGKWYGCTIDNNPILIRLGDEAGKVDLNHASERLLTTLLKGLEMPATDASRLAAAIVDYRDADNERSPDGAEAPEYRRANRASGPKNAPFDDALELAHVLGIDELFLSRLLRHVTVSSGLAGVDPAAATPDLLALLSIGAAGASASQASLDQERSRAIPPELSAVSARNAFSITAQAVGSRGGTFAREAVFRLTRAGPRPFQIVSWRQVNAAIDVTSTEMGGC